MGFISFLLCVAALSRCVLKSRGIRFHCAVGIAALAVSVLHAVITLAKIPQLSVTAVSGLVCVALLAALAAGYMLRRRFSALPWLPIHRALAISLAAAMVWHLISLK